MIVTTTAILLILPYYYDDDDYYYNLSVTTVIHISKRTSIAASIERSCFSVLLLKLVPAPVWLIMLVRVHCAYYYYCFYS